MINGLLMKRREGNKLNQWEVMAVEDEG